MEPDDFSEPDDVSEESYQVKKKGKKRSNKALDKKERLRRKFLDTEVEVEDNASEFDRGNKRKDYQIKESLYYHADELKRKNAGMSDKIIDIEKRYKEKQTAKEQLGNVVAT